MSDGAGLWRGLTVLAKSQAAEAAERCPQRAIQIRAALEEFLRLPEPRGTIECSDRIDAALRLRIKLNAIADLKTDVPGE